MRRQPLTYKDFSEQEWEILAELAESGGKLPLPELMGRFPGYRDKFIRSLGVLTKQRIVKQTKKDDDVMIKIVAQIADLPDEREDPVLQRRECLKCGITFSSEWCGNRLCPPCRRHNYRRSVDLDI